MQRFFVQPQDIQGQVATLRGTDVRHISRVLRLEPGDAVILCDGEGTEYPAQLLELSADHVTFSLGEARAAQGEPPLELVLVQGLPKADKMDWVVQKTTELGVTEILPVRTERSVVHLDTRKAAARQERWQRIALEAAKQTGRGRIPQVGSVLDLPDALAQAIHGNPAAGSASRAAKVLPLFPWEEQQGSGLKQVLQTGEGVGRVVITIGPEGGFSPGEAETARELGYLPVSLGPRILRTETAGMVVLTMILYEWGDLGAPGSPTQE